jgi:hypothetical protein
VAAGANLNFGGGTHTLAAPSRITGPGRVIFGDPIKTTIEGSYNVADSYVDHGSVVFNSNATTGTLTMDTGGLRGSGTVTVNGPLTWTGSGTMAGPGKTVVYGTLLINGDGYKSLAGRTLDNWGYAIWSGSNIGVGDGTVIINERDATFDVQNNGSMDKEYGGVAPRFDNWGTLRKVGSGTKSFGDEVHFNNYGAVEADVGTLRLGSCTSSGSITVAAGANLDFGTYIQTAGVTILNSGTLAARNMVDIQGGTFAGAGIVNANVQNAGAIYVGGTGAAGILVITGNYTQTSVGILNMKLGNFDNSNYDQLLIGGTADLNGTLNVTLLDSFFARAGDGYHVLRFGSRSGNFTTMQLPDLLEPIYGDNSLTLWTTARP